MTTTLLLRIASVISLVFTAGHTLGGLQKLKHGSDCVYAFYATLIP